MRRRRRRWRRRRLAVAVERAGTAPAAEVYSGVGQCGCFYGGWWRRVVWGWPALPCRISGAGR